MVRKYLLPIFALLGLLMALFMVIYGARTTPVPPIPFPPPSPPYEHYVGGAGTIESASREISIGSSLTELITNIYVKVGDVVPKGTPLFRLDTRQLEASLIEAKRAKEVAEVNYENQKTELSLYERLKDKRAVSENEYNQIQYATELALKELKEAEASIEVIQTSIDRSLVVAPIAGEVLQINVLVGESVEPNPFNSTPLMLFGQTDPLHIRVEVDEDDAWRIEKGAPAMAYARGNSSIAVPLTFLYIEPFIVPKATLTGDNTERVDTRVLQIVYEFTKKDLPLYTGQIMDVYIKGLPSDAKF